MSAAEQSLIEADPRLEISITTEKWVAILGYVASGMPLGQALDKVSVPRPLIEGLLRLVPERRKELHEALLAARRQPFDIDTVLDICTDIASGEFTVKDACARRGRKHGQFLALALIDPYVKDLYDEARRVQAEHWADQAINMADDTSNDFDLTGKGNLAGVKRSELMVNTRMRLMERFNAAKYGKQHKTEVNVNLTVNHAERLEAARKRAAQARGAVTVDGELEKVPRRPVASVATRQLAAEVSGNQPPGSGNGLRGIHAPSVEPDPRWLD